MSFMTSLSEEGGSAQSAAQGMRTAGNKAKGHARVAGERSVLATGLLCSGALQGLLLAELLLRASPPPRTSSPWTLC